MGTYAKSVKLYPVPDHDLGRKTAVPRGNVRRSKDSGAKPLSFILGPESGRDEAREPAGGLVPGGGVARLVGRDGERAGDDGAGVGQRADPAPAHRLEQHVAGGGRRD